MAREDLPDASTRQTDHLADLAVRATVAHEPDDAVVALRMLAARRWWSSSREVPRCSVDDALALWLSLQLIATILYCTVMSSPCDADRPTVGHGAGAARSDPHELREQLERLGAYGVRSDRQHELGRCRPGCCRRCRRRRRCRSGRPGLSTPRTVGGGGCECRVSPTRRPPFAFGGALLQVSENAVLPTCGIEVTEIASGPVQPGDEVP